MSPVIEHIYFSQNMNNLWFWQMKDTSCKYNFLKWFSDSSLSWFLCNILIWCSCFYALGQLDFRVMFSFFLELLIIVFQLSAENKFYYCKRYFFIKRYSFTVYITDILVTYISILASHTPRSYLYKFTNCLFLVFWRPL